VLNLAHRLRRRRSDQDDLLPPLPLSRVHLQESTAYPSSDLYKREGIRHSDIVLCINLLSFRTSLPMSIILQALIRSVIYTIELIRLRSDSIEGIVLEHT
jgi:hypothetical protein